MRFKPRDYQLLAAEDVAQFLRCAKPGEKRLYAAPTGTGKSVMELLAQTLAGAGTWIVTPRLEIVAGLLDKLGADVGGWSEAELIRVAEIHRIALPVRLRNRLLRGEGECPERLILDESHHSISTTYQQLDVLTGRCPAVGFTATPYRGTPAGTAAFRAEWGEPVWVLTLPEAIERGVLSFPRCRIEPLVDDDVIEVKNGEFTAKSLTAETASRVHDAASLAAGWLSGGKFDRPTMASLPTVEACHCLAEALTLAGVPNVIVTGDSSRSDRLEAFKATLDCRAILLQVFVVSEGVDLPIRRLLDLAPSISPVRWLQQLGRITRPVSASEDAPEYVCTNRNLLRHAYLLDGALPAAWLKDAQAAFPDSTKRTADARVIGFEALGKLKAIELPLRDGLKGTCYTVSRVEDNKVRQYAVIAHPLRETPIWATRENIRQGDGTTAYSRWRRCEPPEGLTGFASLPPSPLTDKQKAWWKRDAGRFGLDPDAAVNQKSFQALPVLADLRKAV